MRGRHYSSRRNRKNKKILSFVLAIAVVAGLSYLSFNYFSSFFKNVDAPVASPTQTPQPTQDALDPQLAQNDVEPMNLNVDLSAPKHSYTFDISINQYKLECVQKLVYDNQTGDDLKDIVFRLFPNCLSDAANLPIDSPQAITKATEGIVFSKVLIDGAPAKWAIEGKRKTTMRITPTEPIKSGEKSEFIFAYTLDIPQGTYFLSANARSIQLGYFYPAPAQYEKGQWQITDINPSGAPWYLDISDYSATITVPSSQSFASSGSILDQSSAQQGSPGRSTRTYHVNAPSIRSFSMVLSNVGKTAKVESVTAYSNYQEKARSMATMGNDILKYYQTIFGDTMSLTIIQGSIYQNTDAQSNVVIIDQQITSGTNANLEYHIATAIGKQWFGLIIGGDPKFNKLLSEYYGAMYFSSKSAADVETYLAMSEGANALYEHRLNVGAIEFDDALKAYIDGSKGDQGDRQLFIDSFEDKQAISNLIEKYC